MEGDVLEELDSGVWLSIGDLMSGLLMFFALLFVTTQLQLHHKYQDVQRLEGELQAKTKEVDVLKTELQAKIEELDKYQKAFQDLPLILLAQLDSKMGGSDLSVDPKTGDVSIGDRILFDSGSAELKPEGKVFLQQFIPAYSQIIFSTDDFRTMVTRVIIEGHTSSDGDEYSNLDLSLQRSLSVADYISSEMSFANQENFKNKVLAAGRGESDADKNTDNPSDRKVVFRFQLKPPDWQQFLGSS
jgi:outer membrane protein OmpA-like peptidoglycan-associated protein